MRDTWKSKKLWYAYASLGAITWFPLKAASLPVIIPMYATFVGGVMGLAALILAANVGNKAVEVQAQKVQGAQPNPSANADFQPPSFPPANG